MREVYVTQKEDSVKGDFVDLVQKDLKELQIEKDDNEIEKIRKGEWKSYVDTKVKEAAYKYLINENKTKDKTKDINFNELKMSEYLYRNTETSLTKIIFATRSGTLDIKEWNPWKYHDLSCVGCGTEAETMHHCKTCMAYGNETEYTQWKDI